MFKGIDYRGIAVANSGVFAGDTDGYFAIEGVYFVGEIAPFGPGLSFVAQIDSVLYFEQSQDLKIQPAFSELSWYHINAGGIGQRNNSF